MSKALWNTLHNVGLVSGAQPEASATSVPIYLRLLAGLAGWIAVLFSLAIVYNASRLVAEVFLLRGKLRGFDGNIFLLMAILYSGLALVLSFFTRHSVFLLHLVRAGYVVSQIMFVVSLLILYERAVFVPYIVLLVNLILFFVFSERLLRLMSCHIMLACLAWAFWDTYLYLLLPAFLLVAGVIWLNLIKLARWNRWLEPLAQSVTLFFVLGIFVFYISYSAAVDNAFDALDFINTEVWRWFGKANLACCVISAGLGIYLIRHGNVLQQTSKMTAVQGLLIVMVLLMSIGNYWIIGVSGIALLLALVVRIGYYSLAIQLLVSLLLLLAFYYYSLHLNLLHKSLLLILSGVCLLGIYWLMQCVAPTALVAQEQQHD